MAESSITPGNKYKVTNAKSGTVLDLSGTDNKSIIGFGYHQGPNQQWVMERSQNGWQFKNAGNNQYLNIDGEPRDGTPVIGSQDAREWHIWPDEKNSSVFRICVPNTTENLDLSGHGNSADNTPITLWNKWEGEHQTWKFEQV